MARKKKLTPSGQWRSRIVETGSADPHTLIPHGQNWRRHPTSQREALKGILAEVGWVQGVIVNRTTNRIVDGHARVEEAITNGETVVPVTYVELSENEEREVLATLDPLGAMATTDAESLKRLVKDVQTADRTVAKLLTSISKTSARESAGPVLSNFEYRIVVDCKGERHQAQLLKQLEKQGLICRPLIS